MGNLVVFSFLVYLNPPGSLLSPLCCLIIFLSFHLSVFSSFCLFIFLPQFLAALPPFSCLVYSEAFIWTSEWNGYQVIGPLRLYRNVRETPFGKQPLKQVLPKKIETPPPPLSFLDSFFLSDGRYGIRNENIRSAFFQQ